MGKRFLLWFVPPLGALFIRLLWWSNKKRFHIPSPISLDPDRPVVIVFWHGELLLQPFIYRKLRADHPITVMVSEHFDGELIVRIVKYFGIEAIRGSSRRGAVKVLVAALKKIKEGYDVAITPDGPRGPRYSVAPGVVALAQKSGAQIVGMRFRASRFWQLRSWDRFIVPKPFGRIDCYISEPLDIDGMDEEEAKKAVYERLMGLIRE